MLLLSFCLSPTTGIDPTVFWEGTSRVWSQTEGSSSLSQTSLCYSSQTKHEENVAYWQNPAKTEPPELMYPAAEEYDPLHICVQPQNDLRIEGRKLLHFNETWGVRHMWSPHRQQETLSASTCLSPVVSLRQALVPPTFVLLSISEWQRQNAPAAGCCDMDLMWSSCYKTVVVLFLWKTKINWKKTQWLFMPKVSFSFEQPFRRTTKSNL